MLLLLLTSCNASSTLYPFLSIKYAIINDVDLDFPAKLFYLIIIFIIIIYYYKNNNIDKSRNNIPMD
jgi:hypothetical protein